MNCNEGIVPLEVLSKYPIRVSKPKPWTPERKRAYLRHLISYGASFVGKRNHSKVRVLILLFNTPDGYLSAAEISKATGISHGYCRNRLPFWLKWGYLKVRFRKKSEICYVRIYAISRKGYRYLEKVPPEIASQILQELEDYRESKAG